MIGGIGRRRAVVASVFLAFGLTGGLAGCAQPSGGGSASSPGPSPSSPPPADAESPSPRPSPTTDYTVPGTLPGEIARAVYDPTGGEDDSPQTAYTAVSAVQPGVPFVVDGECIGDRVDYQVITAAVDDSARVLTTGTLDCDDPRPSGGYSSPYGGPVQFLVTPVGEVDAAWLVVLPG